MNDAGAAEETVQGEMTCRELVGLVTDYLDGALEPAACLRFEAHLARCTGCRRHLDQMRRTIRSVGRLAEEDLDAAARDRWLGAFRTWKQA
jgi:anti-sigma factor RsiW